MAYFELDIDDQHPGSWSLSFPWELPDGSWKDVWAYTRCERLHEPATAFLEVSHAGDALDFNIATFNIPVVSKRMVEAIARSAFNDVQFVPATVNDDTLWAIMNVLTRVDCLDYSKSIIDFFPTDLGDPSVINDPERAGKPRGVRLLQLDANRIGGRHVFRVTDWEIPIIVSGEIKQLIEETRLTGMTFQQVA